MMGRILALIVALLAAWPAAAEFNPPERMATVKVAPADPVARYPAWLIGLADPVAKPLGKVSAHMVWRKGRLYRQEAARTRLERTLRPLDLVLVQSDGRLSGHLIPGLFAHVAVYLGTERDLARLGVFDDPALARHRAAIAAGNTIIEAENPRVHLSPLDDMADADRLAVLRLPLSTAERARAARKLLAQLGTGFDFHADAGSPDELFCAELVEVAGIARLPSRTAYGRRTIVPTDLASAALSGRNGLTLVLYLRATRSGHEAPGRDQLRHDIDAAW